jgi:nitrate reductase NapE component
MMSTLQTARREMRPWREPAAAAICGWILTCGLWALVAAGSVGAISWLLVALAAVALTIATPAMHAGRVGRSRAEAGAFTFGAIMLTWPLLALLTMVLLSWAGVDVWD